jgi:hypothetical protein
MSIQNTSDSEATASKMAFFIQIDALKSDQACLAQKLAQERTMNRQVRSALANVEAQYLEVRIKRDESAVEVSEMQRRLSTILKEVSEIHKGTNKPLPF